MAISRKISKTLTASEATTPVINMRSVDGAMFSCSAAVSLTFYHCDTPDGTFGEFEVINPNAPDATPVPYVLTPGAGKWYNWPAPGNAGHYWKVVAASGTPVLKITAKSYSI